MLLFFWMYMTIFSLTLSVACWGFGQHAKSLVESEMPEAQFRLPHIRRAYEISHLFGQWSNACLLASLGGIFVQVNVYALFEINLIAREINPLPLASIVCQTTRLIALRYIQHALHQDRQI